jgi:hypothetical protein
MPFSDALVSSLTLLCLCLRPTFDCHILEKWLSQFDVALLIEACTVRHANVLELHTPTMLEF